MTGRHWSMEQYFFCLFTNRQSDRNNAIICHRYEIMLTIQSFLKGWQEKSLRAVPKKFWAVATSLEYRYVQGHFEGQHQFKYWFDMYLNVISLLYIHLIQLVFFIYSLLHPLPPPHSIATLSTGINFSFSQNRRKASFSPLVLNVNLLQGHTSNFPLYNCVSY